MMTDEDLQLIIDSLNKIGTSSNHTNLIYLKDILNNFEISDEIKSSAIMMFNNTGSISINKDELLNNIKIGYRMGKFGEEYLLDHNYEIAGKSFEKAISYGSIRSALSLYNMIQNGQYSQTEKLYSFLNIIISNIKNDDELYKKMTDLRPHLSKIDKSEARHISSDLRFELEFVLRTLTNSKKISNNLIRTAFEEGYIGLNDEKILLKAYENLSDVLHNDNKLDNLDSCIECLENIKLNHPNLFKIHVKFYSRDDLFEEYSLNYGEKIPKPNTNPTSILSGYEFKEWSGYNSGMIATSSYCNNTISFEAIFEPSATSNDKNNKAIYWKNLAFSYLNNDHEYVSEDTDALSEAYRCFKNSAELGDNDSRFNIALMIENRFVEEPLIKAFEIYYDLSHQGDLEASVKLQELISTKDSELYSRLYSFYNSRGQFDDAKIFLKYSSTDSVSRKVENKKTVIDLTAKSKSEPNVVKTKTTSKNHTNCSNRPAHIDSYYDNSPNARYKKINFRGLVSYYGMSGESVAFER